MAFDDDYRAVRDLIAALDASATGNANLELENRIKTERLNAMAARRGLEKARADGYEQGLADGLRIGRGRDG